jgi:hypothetical protein
MRLAGNVAGSGHGSRAPTLPPCIGLQRPASGRSGLQRATSGRIGPHPAASGRIRPHREENRGDDYEGAASSADTPSAAA